MELCGSRKTAFYLHPSINSEMPAYYLNKEVSAHCQKFIPQMEHTLVNIPYAEISGDPWCVLFTKLSSKTQQFATEES